MKQWRHEYPIKLMARVLGVARSGYYEWLKHKPTIRSIRHQKAKSLIHLVHIESRETYGAIRTQKELAETHNLKLGRDQIAMLKKELGLKCKQLKKFKATTNSNHDLPVAPNLLEQHFDIVKPGTVLGTDITYIHTDEGWLYLAGVKDFASKEIVGYAMGDRMNKALVSEALKKAISYRKPDPDCIHHSDRGSQYCAISYQKEVIRAGLRPSMSRKGNCYDNAPTESFWGCLKQELVYQHRFKTRIEAQAAIQEYIEVFYNRIRRHSSIGNIAPANYVNYYYKERKSALVIRVHY